MALPRITLTLSENPLRSVEIDPAQGLALNQLETTIGPNELLLITNLCNLMREYRRHEEECEDCRKERDDE